MHFLSFIAVAGVLSTSVVSAEPTLPQVPKVVDCKAVNLALTVLKKLGPPATSFCSSYLKVPATKTVSITTTTPTITVTTSTSTVTVTSSVCEAPKRRSPGQLSNDRSSDLQTKDVRAEPVKRHNIPALSVFAAAKLSSGCSCLSLMPKTSVTATVTAPTSTVNVVATTTACVVPVCTSDGGRCDLDRPDLCCGQICASFQGAPFPTCLVQRKEG
ncbi:hypothetical protein AA0119_g10197 [Alternaria tenuissima]|uniref:Hydrophobin n=1 Tax=Alternaria tenuissima TaxID=119927 RepID=A0A4Q4S9H3_9PLEO|nr:hypothetical protein AA0115_g10864 [Alternaria tenuissima]RYN92168.1 hypothetical protein AA0119_g10197 [Alternaria tenuissima]RYO08299.1 hypothetical protein AA0121_g11470 [Alternaria tenuissima]RYO66273.1 hypothetical protein AA0116_g2912 [Alternaria tenuissima]